MMPLRSRCGPLGPRGRGGTAVGPKARDSMATGSSINSFALDVDELGCLLLGTFGAGSV
jgi:hypothetical protein